MLNELCDKIHQNAVDHGFYEGEKNIPEILMLIVSELGEAMEAYRKDHYADLKNGYYKYMGNIPFDLNFKDWVKDTFEDEIADTIIRLLDLCGYMKIDIDTFVRLKMEYNETRPYKHNKIC